MEDYSTRDLLSRGVAAAKAKEPAEARRYLERLLHLDPPLEYRVTALIYLGEISENPVEKRKWIEEALAYDPSDMRARRLLLLLDGKLKAEEVIDPDRLVVSDNPADQQAGAKRFICPQCGGRMTFKPDGSSLTCEFCEARQSLGAGAAQHKAEAAESFLIAMATRKGHLHPTSRQTFNCQGCGADFILPPQQITHTCPFCASASIVRRAESRELIDPHAIFPFTVAEDAARRALKAWLDAENFGSDLRVEPGAGVYFPAWSFEMAGIVPWRCLVEDSRNHWIPETGQEIVYHTGVLIPATTRLSETGLAELRSFDIKQAEPFDERYLANWMAETYQVEVGDASLEARSWTYEFEKDSVRSRFLRPYRDLTFNSTDMTIESFKLVLLPLWLSHYHTGGKRWEVVINGQTGQVRGQQPPRGWLGKIFN